ncbi:kinesin-like protein KIN-14D isoform X1 [Cinnamomum micranthum f. kanehirae]|uniref:Kinesin-like protein KIN-14D isoform X1 n=1 Tax=Cinnamomum micranthum f. kanehirae TaxID=337451 RepID=A0A3S3PRA3_9MAGN|nr:kinesin-like protein KIN-14D isoform X1 [Cinnamomum micranthum f. kanehirae]
MPESPPPPTEFTDVNVVPEHEKKEFEEAISNLQGEITALKSKQRSLDEKRREALNKILDIKGSIRVFCRVRPFLSVDRRKIHLPISTGSENVIVRSSGSRKDFTLDKVFPQEATQEEVFEEVVPILRSALDGHNICIFAYGQTGTGKTFTMEGTNDHPGIVPRAIQELFRQASQDTSASFTFSMSMLEVYMGSLRTYCHKKPPARKLNQFLNGSNGSVEIERLTDVVVADFAQAIVVFKGRRARSTSWTSVNEASSRSHCLTRITIARAGDTQVGKPEPSKLWMVDLGGSERLLKTGATGQTMDEGKAINLSLSALGDVIAALKRKRNHIPYRNSKLTQILRDSLGDGSKALMVVHISPSEDDAGETTCSLNFAKRARAIESNRDLPEDLKKQRENRLAELDDQMRDAEEECQKIKNNIKAAEFLLKEKKKLFSLTYQPLDEHQESPRSPSVDQRKVTESPRTFEKSVRRNMSSSVPHFMSSTVCSRQRKGVDGDISGRSRTPGSGNRHLSKLFASQSQSQSLSYSDHYFKENLRSSRNGKKSGLGEPNAIHTENPSCNSMDLKSSSIPRSKRVSMSHPNLRVTFSHHRRRMSDLS